MKIAIVNDCAYVMHDLSFYLEKHHDIIFISRSRGLWSKTFGLAWKILKSEADIYHVNYALQDAYLISKLKHLDILHVHGSDVRWTMYKKPYGWIVKHNLKKAKKVLYATPDLISHILKIRKDAEYLPTPVRTEIFKPKKTYNNPPKAIYFKLWYEKIPDNLTKALLKNEIELHIFDKCIPYSHMPYLLSKYDIFISCFTINWFTKTCLEAMSCGLATIDFRHKNKLEERAKYLSDPENVRTEGLKNIVYIRKNHSAEKIAYKLLKIYEEMKNDN